MDDLFDDEDDLWDTKYNDNCKPKDVVITCTTCGKGFDYTIAIQENFAKRGLPAPEVCRPCTKRAARPVRDPSPMSFAHTNEDSFGGRSTQNRYTTQKVKMNTAADRSRVRNPRLEVELFGDPNVVRKRGGINFDKYDDIPVTVDGSNVPREADNFESLNLEECLKENVRLARYTNPTPVQRYGIPIGLAGRDLMACAQTGSGKTAAFLLTALNENVKQGPAPVGHGRSRAVCPRTVIMAPTRELAIQIFDESRKFTYCTGLRSVVVYGGKPSGEQIRDLQKGCDVVVATPGRLKDFLGRRVISFKDVTHLILDEADRMLDMGFEPEIRAIVENFDMPRTGKRQTLLFSATFPRDIQRMARDFLSNSLYLKVGRVGATSDNIKQVFYHCEDHEKLHHIRHVLNGSSGLTLIFVNRKRDADILEDELSEEGITTCAIHGDRTQEDREFALNQFKSGRCMVMVATDVAARGWDIPNVTTVINYDLPSNIDVCLCLYITDLIPRIMFIESAELDALVTLVLLHL